MFGRLSPYPLPKTRRIFFPFFLGAAKPLLNHIVNMVSMADLPLFPQDQSTQFSENSLCKCRQQVSEDMTEGRHRISSTLKKTGFGYSHQSRLIRSVREAKPGSSMD